MSRALGAAMPPDLVARLGGRDLAAVASKAIQVFTMDDAGRPHPALLSYFEVVAKDATRLRLAVYGTSATSANIRRSGVLTLVVIDERVVYYVKTRASERAPVMRAARWNAAFECRVEQVLADEPNEKIEPGAYVAGGITYVNPGRAAELERAAAVLAELLE